MRDLLCGGDSFGDEVHGFVVGVPLCYNILHNNIDVIIALLCKDVSHSILIEPRFSRDLCRCKFAEPG